MKVGKNQVSVSAYGLELAANVEAFKKDRIRVTMKDKIHVIEALEHLIKRKDSGYLDVDLNEKITATVYKSRITTQKYRWICVSFYLTGKSYVSFGVSDIPVGWKLFSLSGYTGSSLQISIAFYYER